MLKRALDRRRADKARRQAVVDEIAEIVADASLVYAMRVQGFGQEALFVDVSPETVLDRCFSVAGGNRELVSQGLGHGRFDELRRVVDRASRGRVPETEYQQGLYIAGLGMHLRGRTES